MMYALRRRIHRQKWFIIGVVGILLLVFYKLLPQRPTAQWDFVDTPLIRDEHPKPAEKYERWAVVTTIHPPTSAMKALAKLSSWKLVVVGDLKTPADWRLDGAVYLSPEDQRKLPFGITKLLPWNSYARKMLGYLYAIQHGATVLYDVDDDNVPGELDVFHLGTSGPGIMVHTSNLTYNPYLHFGQSTVWPRGYPLEYISQAPSYQQRIYFCDHHATPIQQGLVDGDPDVDAIFRLTRKEQDVEMNISFDSQMPPIMIPSGTFAPFNSQNTVFLYSAFWAMFLPASVSQRVCDIHRAYWAQRLLWFVGKSVGFYPPTSVHERNPHSYIKDAMEESDLYNHAGKLVKFLGNWDCHKLHFFYCISDLTKAMQMARYWTREDVNLLDAWLEDLALLGYLAPTLKTKHTEPCMGNYKVVQVYPHEMETVFLGAKETAVIKTFKDELAAKYFSQICGKNYVTEKQPVSANKILLVVTLMSDTDIKAIDTYYRQYFSHILYCSHKDVIVDQNIITDWKLSYVHLDHAPGATDCVVLAMHMGYNVDGFLHVTDSILLDYNQISKLNRSQLWMLTGTYVYDQQVLQQCKKGALHCTQVSKANLDYFKEKLHNVKLGSRVHNKLQQCFKKLLQDPVIGDGLNFLVDSSYYIPVRLSKLFIQITDGLFQQVAVLSNPKAKANNIPYNVLTLLMLECSEILHESLACSGIDSNKEEQIVCPFIFSNIASKHTPEHKYFCKLFNMQ